MIKSIPNKTEQGGNIFDFIRMANQVTVKREQGMNQDVSSLDYMNKVPRLNRIIKTNAETLEWLKLLIKSRFKEVGQDHTTLSAMARFL